MYKREGIRMSEFRDIKCQNEDCIWYKETEENNCDYYSNDFEILGCENLIKNEREVK